MKMSIRIRIAGLATKRPPDFVIGGDEPYLLRWFLIPRNPIFNIYLHEFWRDDDDRALHDHPWLFNASWLLRGAYIEHTIKAGGLVVKTLRQAGAFKLRVGPAPHRLELTTNSVGDKMKCWTLFITGPRVRSWGFYCMERGWIHWKQFTAPDDKGAVGAGCDA
jgi:hypothetical protein